MDLFDHHYYKINKIMMTIIGLWPTRSVLTRRLCKAVILYFYISEMVTRIFTIFKNYNDSDMIRDCMIEMFIQITAMALFLGFISFPETTLVLLNRIRADWQIWARERELNFLHEYAELGKRINIAYGVTIYTCGFFVMMEPIAEKIIDVLLRNGTEPGKFLLMINYYHVDEQKYYYYVITYFNVATLAIGTPVATSLIMLVSYTQHANGIFAALRHKLACIGNNDKTLEPEKTLSARDHRDKLQLAWCIDRHNDALEYVRLTDAAFKWTLFVSMILGVLLINGLGLLILTTPNNRQVTMTCMAIILFSSLYFLVICATSQSVIDHSFSIRVYIYNSQWYRLSPKAQKLLDLMIMRCNVPSQITAGNMLSMSTRTLWLTAKTTFSYFAFIRSTQGY